MLRDRLFLPLGEGNDGDDEDGEVVNKDLQPMNLGHEDEWNPAENNDLQPAHTAVNLLLTPTSAGQNKEEEGFDPANVENIDPQTHEGLEDGGDLCKFGGDPAQIEEGCDPTNNANHFDPAQLIKRDLSLVKKKPGLRP